MERRGPALAAAYAEDGCPTPAAVGFARSCGVEPEQLQTLETDKGAWLVYRSMQHGKATSELLPGIVEESLAKLPIPKRMRWGSSAVQFVRPVHWVVLLLGDEPVEAKILGLTAGRETRGHRFHHPGRLYLAEPSAYEPLLETEGHVIADFDTRRRAIRAQVEEAAARHGGIALIDEDLLNEVTGLVEWPVAVTGNFDMRFLEVPAEALISSMQGHQKYFPVVNARKHLMPHFVTVANIDSRDSDKVREGNERVIRPRLSDAAFFWEQDRKTPLHARVDSLKTVVFQKRLGTLYDKTLRVEKLAGTVASALGEDTAVAQRAAFLSKCDLMTAMVGEFPELQGIMGRYYAAHDGEPEAVAVALDEQYMPRFAGDNTPQSAAGQALAIADRLDTLVGIFAIGQPPSGDKDPFALRRAALSVLRTIIEHALPLDLLALLKDAAQDLPQDVQAGARVDDVFDFMMDRLRAYYADAGVAADVFEAVHVRRPARPYDFDRRVRAVNAFRALPEAESLAAANKRIRNILRQTEEPIPGTVEYAKLSEKSELALYEQLQTLRAQVTPLLDTGEYTEAMTQLATLRESVDAFFDDVMVMVEDADIRTNRLALLNTLSELFLRVADLSRLQG